MSHYQETQWKKNQNRIIQLLNEKSLTFTELIEKTGLSRSAVNKHLNSLEKEDVIEKRYASGKIVNVLQLSRLDIIEWFLAQLEILGIPEGVIARGRAIMCEEVIPYAMLLYAYTWKNMIELSGGFTEKPSETAVSWGSVIPSKTESPPFRMFIEENEKEIVGRNLEILKKWLKEMNPYTFNVVLTIYRIELIFIEKAKELKVRNESLYPDIHELYPEKAERLTEKFHDIMDWWFTEVSEHLPSSRFFQALTIVYSNAIYHK